MNVYIYTLIATLVINYLYNIYKVKMIDNDRENSYSVVEKFLVNNQTHQKDKMSDISKKDILWVHMTYEKNSRWWKSFYSRTSDDLNQPYLYLTVKSIIDKCGNDFNVCIIDDTSFATLIPSWEIDLSLVPDPIKTNIRELAIAKVLYTYGGVSLPPSFLCFTSFYQTYIKYNETHGMFVGELVNTFDNADTCPVYPSSIIIGCQKSSDTIMKYINHLEKNISTDYVSQGQFTGENSRWLYKNNTYGGPVGIIPAKELGAKDSDGKVILLDDLMNTTYISLPANSLGLYIPSSQILNRTAYNWFARLSAKQALESDTNIGKLLLIK